MTLRVCITAGFLLSLFLGVQQAGAQSPGPMGGSKDGKEGSSGGSDSRPSPPTPPYVNILKDAKPPTSGMWTLYQKNQNVYWEINPSDYAGEYIVLIAISRGIAQGDLVGGNNLNWGNDWVWQFR